MAHHRLMGRATGRSSSAAGGAVVSFATGRRGETTAIDIERDAVWFSHRSDLMRASALLRSLPALDARELEELCTTMERIGASVGLDGPWRTFETQSGVVRLSYISRWEERMPTAKNEYRRHDLLDDFDGRLIGGLPEPRYLGRLIQALASEYGSRPQSPLATVG